MKTLTPLLASLLAASACAATSLCAGAASSSREFKTSFDCATTRVAIEKRICRDPQLAQMDIELQRLYLLVLTDDHAEPPRNKVEIDQQFWLDARNQCATDREPKACTIRSYAERAYQLRQGSAIARTKDPTRLTEGPVAFRCSGLKAVIAATFFTVEPGVVYLKWANTSITLNQQPSTIGTRYGGKDFRGSYIFWYDGDDALLQMPGSAEMSCKAEPVG